MENKALSVLWEYVKSAFSTGLEDGVKGMLTGGGVGALSETWKGFVVGMFAGALFGAIIGSTLGKVFDLLLESIHLLLNLRKVRFSMEIENIPSEIGEALNPNYLLIRYGRDEVILVSATTNQDRLATRLRNKEIKIQKEYDAANHKLIMHFVLKEHVSFGTQFKMFFTGVSFEKLEPYLSKVPYIKEVTSGGGDQSKTYVLLENNTPIHDIRKNKTRSIVEVKSIEGIPNNFIYPK
ncbi:hypothetical protein OAO55_00765 [Bacteroidales bacterium]|nr:hypothetical protein [Bacteroidales bacterium]